MNTVEGILFYANQNIYIHINLYVSISVCIVIMNGIFVDIVQTCIVLYINIIWVFECSLKYMVSRTIYSKYLTHILVYV